MNEYIKAEKYNLKWWHRLRNPFGRYEAHHVFPGQYKSTILRCCPHFWTLAVHGHQDNWEWVEAMKELLQEDKRLLMSNQLGYSGGCIIKLWWECDKCYYFRRVK